MPIEEERTGGSAYQARTPGRFAAGEPAGAAVIGVSTSIMAKSLTQFTILTVDDDSAARAFSRLALKQLGVRHVIEADSGIRALEKIARIKFDAVFSDWQMPRFDGLDLLRQIRSMADHAHLPFFMVSSIDEVDKVREVLKAGATGYILKPYTVATVEEKLKAIVMQGSRSPDPQPTRPVG